jgi:hypothetical protein
VIAEHHERSSLLIRCIGECEVPVEGHRWDLYGPRRVAELALVHLELEPYGERALRH